MKTIEIDDELYAFIASQTKHIGESACEILRRLLIEAPGIVTTVITTGEAPAPVTTKSKPANAETAPVAEPVAAPEPVAQSSVPAAVTPAAAPVSPASADDFLSKVNKAALAQFDKRVDQFLFILQQVYLQHPTDFAKVETIVGKNRKYFASSKEELLKSGSSTNPKAIPESGFWVVTNNNTAKKLSMLAQVLQLLGYEDTVVNTVTETFDS